MLNNDMEHTRPAIALADLLDAIDVLETRGDIENTEITSIESDSRRAAPGTLFVAVRGTAVDSHRFLGAAAAAGAVVVGETLEGVPAGAVAVRVPDSRMALGQLASRFYGEPSEELTLVGVTGTNGKTTVATLLYESARLRGLKAGLISTVANIIDGKSTPAEHTTPDPVSLNALLRRMVDAGCTFAAMEVSSHAADQHRIAGLTFAGGIFTNITRDHLDYHKTFAAYLAAKKSFFDMLPPSAFALTNADDRNGAVIVQNTAARPVAYYSTRDIADFTVKIVEDRLDGMLLEIDGAEVETRFAGRFNASNLAAVYGANVLLGVPRDSARLEISSLVPVAGRFQTFRSRRGITGIVDFAHTPDALVNVLDTIAETAGDNARVICVCGAGGDRDAGKRPLMARAASERCDLLVLTSDNPRSEDPDEIIRQMLAGVDPSRRDDVIIEPDRAAAIRTAVANAGAGDVVLVAGKGHETTQTLADRTIHFDDREELTAALADDDASYRH